MLNIISLFYKYIIEFIEFINKNKKLKYNTIKAYNNDLLQFYEYYLEEKLPKEISLINVNHLKKYMFFLYESGYKKATIKRKLTSLNAFFNYLVSNNVIKYNNFNLIKLPKVEKKSPVFISKENIIKLVQLPDIKTDLGLRDNCILEIICSTGIRLNELVKINISDIDFNFNYITINVQGRKRVLPINKKTKKTLELYIKSIYKTVNKNHYEYALFKNSEGKRLSARGARYIIDSYLKRMFEEKVTIAVLRNSFAIHLSKNGTKLNKIHELLGNSSLATTENYSKSLKMELKYVYDKTHPRA